MLYVIHAIKALSSESLKTNITFIYLQSLVVASISINNISLYLSHLFSKGKIDLLQKGFFLANTWNSAQ